MVSKIHADSDEGNPDEEQASRALRIAVVSERVSYLLSVNFVMWERSFLIIGKVLAPCRGRSEGVYQRQGSR